MAVRVAFFDDEYGIGLTIDAGSGRSWMDQPGGDPRHAHCRLDVPADTLVAGSAVRPSSGTLFVPWGSLLQFADELAAGGTARIGDRHAWLTVRMRRDGRLRAETAFTQGHHVEVTLRCRTLWDRHSGTREDLPRLAEQVRSAVRGMWPGTRVRA